MKLSVLAFDADALPRQLELPVLVFSGLLLALALSVGFDGSASFVRPVASAVAVTLCVGFLYSSGRFMGSATSLPSFAAPVLSASGVSSLVFFAAGLAALAVDSGIHFPGLFRVVSSLALLYVIALFGWSVGHAARLRHTRSWLLGVFGAVLLAAVHAALSVL